MRLTLGQRFWIFAALLATGSIVLGAMFVGHQVEDYRRHTRTLELTGLFHGALEVRRAMALESQPVQSLMGLPPTERGAIRQRLRTRRALTDRALDRVEIRMRTLSGGDRAVAQVRMRDTRARLVRGRAVVDAELARPLQARTVASVRRALAADAAVERAFPELLDLVEGRLRENDPGAGPHASFARMTADVYVRVARQATDLVPALAAGAPIDAGLRERLLERRGEIEYAALSLARRAGFFAKDDARIAPAVARVTDPEFPLVGNGRIPVAGITGSAVPALIDDLASRAATVAVLREAALDLGAARADAGRDRARWAAIWSVAVVTALMVALTVFLVWARRSVLSALEGARRELVLLTQGDTSEPPARTRPVPPEVESLYAAVADLRRKERRRARLEEERTALHAQLRHEATTDALTGLVNRRAVDEIGARWAAGAPGTAPALGVVLADIDHFKAINDTGGHLVGDRVLEIVARRLVAAVRPTDTVARYGGEEFIVLAENITPDALRRLAEDLRRTIGDHPFAIETGESLEVHISAGIAHAGRGDCGWSELLAAADAALYRAKARGRDRVEVGITGRGDGVPAP